MILHLALLLEMMAFHSNLIEIILKHLFSRPMGAECRFTELQLPAL
jgi:hypothetical protein